MVQYHFYQGSPSSFWLLISWRHHLVLESLLSYPNSNFLLAVLMLLFNTIFVLIKITKNHGRQSIIQSIWMSFMPRILCVSSFTFNSSSFLQGIMGHRTFQQETKSANDDSSPTRRWTFYLDQAATHFWSSGQRWSFVSSSFRTIECQCYHLRSRHKC